MVITRAQSASINQAIHTKMNDYCENESDISLPGLSSQNLNARNNDQHIAIQ